MINTTSYRDVQIAGMMTYLGLIIPFGIMFLVMIERIGKRGWGQLFVVFFCTNCIHATIGMGISVGNPESNVTSVEGMLIGVSVHVPLSFVVAMSNYWVLRRKGGMFMLVPLCGGGLGGLGGVIAGTVVGMNARVSLYVLWGIVGGSIVGGLIIGGTLMGCCTKWIVGQICDYPRSILLCSAIVYVGETIAIGFFVDTFVYEIAGQTYGFLEFILMAATFRGAWLIPTVLVCLDRMKRLDFMKLFDEWLVGLECIVVDREGMIIIV